ncbi:helicase [Leucobacter sp. OH2974_COT-288]|uniref:Secretion/DNA translocation related TadE-like protein n=1 Tax=Canibacter oris TaxID=1365628 RepID=A0A840DJ73_9MICO|nr:helicase [Canibacter oris]MBB4071763.1 secretion/DNA translocation related TadE-like protein [Canibacter oris]RRD35129.1 helicase [Leucobacter sp. OH2974_COT-288]
MSAPLAVGIIAAVTVTATGVLAGAALAATQTRVAAAADNAALAAADTAFYNSASNPCAAAQAVAAAHYTELLQCTVDGWRAVVRVGAGFGHYRVQAVAAAG